MRTCQLLLKLYFKHCSDYGNYDDAPVATDARESQHEQYNAPIGAGGRTAAQDRAIEAVLAAVVGRDSADSDDLTNDPEFAELALPAPPVPVQPLQQHAFTEPAS